MIAKAREYTLIAWTLILFTDLINYHLVSCLKRQQVGLNTCIKRQTWGKGKEPILATHTHTAHIICMYIYIYM